MKLCRVRTLRNRLHYPSSGNVTLVLYNTVVARLVDFKFKERYDGGTCDLEAWEAARPHWKSNLALKGGGVQGTFHNLQSPTRQRMCIRIDSC